MSEPQEIAAKAATSTWDDVRLWGAVVISLVSLCVSERNRQSTNKATKKLRKQTLRLEEFRTGVKTPLIDALKDCEEAATKSEAIARSGKTLKQLGQDIQDLNRATIDALSKVETRLTDANHSEFAEGDDWLEDFNGYQDKILAGFNEASNPVNSEASRRDALLKVKTNLGALRSSIKSRIDFETNAITSDAEDKHALLSRFMRWLIKAV
ncbi:hypothetical protein O3S81_13430 [Agrobacterium sp. SOY23]|uniref:hypothetical protein n=1 Tax=Agrobacterium sp. SOY23 TaxID=3014555 RepID=UPI0022AF6CD8|nr:hypothetical protein [Agrobacterium sp. SOY23]MCZ4430701.1 hypothetical protein [Agrobacterium sp. SOY23]